MASDQCARDEGHRRTNAMLFSPPEIASVHQGVHEPKEPHCQEEAHCNPAQSRLRQSRRESPHAGSPCRCRDVDSGEECSRQQGHEDWQTEGVIPHRGWEVSVPDGLEAARHAAARTWDAHGGAEEARGTVAAAMRQDRGHDKRQHGEERDPRRIYHVDGWTGPRGGYQR